MAPHRPARGKVVTEDQELLRQWADRLTEKEIIEGPGEYVTVSLASLAALVREVVGMREGKK